MRTKLFRVWDKMQKCYLDGPFIEGHLYMDVYGGAHNFHNGSGGDELIVQRFTGLQDSTGQIPIFEGDIIRETWEETNHYGFNGPVTREDGSVYAVEWRAPSFFFDTPSWHEQRHIDNWKRVVIGNIFETPELLKN